MQANDTGAANTAHHKIKLRNGVELETIDLIEALDLNHARGEILVALIRAGRKPGESEQRAMKKIEYYVHRELARLLLAEQDKDQEQLPLVEDLKI